MNGGGNDIETSDFKLFLKSFRSRGPEVPSRRLTTINAYAFIVDINSFTVAVASSDSIIIAQNIRDTLAGGTAAVEHAGGEVIAFMGDAFLAILPDAQAVFNACVDTAHDLDRTCEWISGLQRHYEDAWREMPGGPSIKIACEYGWLNISSTTTRLLGEQPLVIGPAINYTERILHDGSGNRCHLGPNAAEHFAALGYQLEGPFDTASGYRYSRFSMSETWREGELEPDDETYWG